MLHHEIAAVDIERRPGDVARRFGRGEANEVGDFQWSAKARNGVRGGQTLEQLRSRMLVRKLRVDHARTHRVYGNAELSQFFRGGSGQSEQTSLRRRIVRAAQRADHASR